MQQPDYTPTTPYYPTYPQNPNTNPTTTTDLHHHQPLTYASAPPFTSTPTPTPTYHPPPPSDYNYPTDPSNPNSQPPSNFPQFETYQSQPPYNHLSASIPHNPITLNHTSSFHNPSSVPTQFPSHFPPTQYPSQVLSQFPSQGPSQSPSQVLSQFPSQGPSQPPSQGPSQIPSQGYEGYNESVYGGNYGRSGYELGGGGEDYYGKRLDLGMSRYESGGGYGDGVYAYQGSKVEPYGSRGTGSKSWKEQVVFDDFGRPIGSPGKGLGSTSGLSPKIVKAVPKAETREDIKGGVQKFRVKLLAESGGQSTMDVLCQIGLDGIRMLDPSTSRTLRIYPLDTITRCDVYDSSTFAFWSKSSVDIEPSRIRLQSNSYTTNTLLDTVTAATIQFKEMGGRSRPVEAVKVTEQSTEKKKGLGDWMNMIKPPNEEKDHWVPDEAVTKCTGCGSDFSAFNRKHHCRNCGDIFCDKCTHRRIALTSEENAPLVRVCDRCMVEVTQRLNSAREGAGSRSSGLQSHEDLAKKLQEELERNHKSSGSKFEVSSRRMKEVACPTCTVHLQVQVPSSGSETIECGVCQHPFLVSAR